MSGLEVIIIKTEVNKTSLDALERQVNSLQGRTLRFAVDTSAVDTKAVNALAKLKNAENALEIQRLKTEQATHQRATAEKNLAIQSERVAEIGVRVALEHEKVASTMAKAALQESKTAAAGAELAVQEQRTAQAGLNLASAQERAAAANARVTSGFNQTSTAATKTGDSIGKAVQKMLLWTAAGTLIYGPIHAFKEALETMKAVNKELVEVSKVTERSPEALKKLGAEAFSIASKYGADADAYVGSVAEFARAGYDDLSEALAELSMKTQIAGNVTEDTANQFLLSVDAAYKLHGNVQELSKVLDGAAKIDNEYATSLQKMAEGLGKIAPIASQAHVPISELEAALGTITAVTQRSGTEAATALRALFLNILGDTKTEIDEGITWTTGEIAGLRDVIRQYAPEAYKAAQATGEVINPMKAIAGLAQSMKEGLLTEQQLMSMVSDIGGKLRTSQLLALIQNWDMYKDMLTAFGEAAGTADAMVAKSLDSWEAKTKVLSNTWTEFISKTIDTEWIKGIIEGITWLIEGLGSLGNVLLILSPIILRSLIPGLISLGGTVINIARYFMALAGGASAAAAGLATGVTAATAANVVFGALALVIAGLVIGINNYRKSLQDAADDAVEASQKANESAENIGELYAAYINAAAGSDELKTAATNLATALGASEDEIDSYIAKIDEMTQAEIDSLKGKAALAKAAAEENVQAVTKDPFSARKLDINWGSSGYSDLDKTLQDILTGVSTQWTGPSGGIHLAPSSQDIEGWDNYYKALLKAQNAIEVFAGKTNNAEILKSDFYKDISDSIETLAASMGAYDKAIKQGLEADALRQIISDLRTKTIDSKQAFDDYIESIKKSTEFSEEYKEILIDAANHAFPQFSGELKDAGNAGYDAAAEIEALAKKIADLNDALNSAQSALKTITAAQKEYADAGSLSVDTVQSLLSLEPEYLAALVDQNGQINLNSAAVEALVSSKTAYLRELAAEQVMSYAVTTLQQRLAEATDDVGTSANDAAGEISTAADTMFRMAAFGISAAVGVNLLGSALDKLANKRGAADKGVDIEAWKQDVREYAVDLAALLNSVGGGIEGFTGGGGSSGGGKTEADEWEKARDALDEYLKELKTKIELMQNQGKSADEIIAVYKAMQERIHMLAETYRQATGIEEDDFTRQLSNLWWDYSEAIAEVLKDTKEKALDAAEEAMDKLRDLKDAQIDALDDQLDALEKQNKAREDAVDLEEKQLAVAKAKEALENARKERVIRIWNASTGQWEWQADAQVVQKAEESLVNAQKALADYYADQKYQQDKQDLQDQKDDLNDAYDEFEKAWETASEAVKNGTMTLEQAFAAMAAAAANIASKYGVDLSGQLTGIAAATGAGTTVGATLPGGGSTTIAVDNSGHTLTPNLPVGTVVYSADGQHAWQITGGNSITSGGSGYTSTQLYDKGGILTGMGGIKGTPEPEAILDPVTTKALTKPIGETAFRENVARIGGMFGNSNLLSGMERPVTSNNTHSVSHDQRIYNPVYVENLAVSDETASAAIAKLARGAKTLSLYSS